MFKNIITILFIATLTNSTSSLAERHFLALEDPIFFFDGLEEDLMADNNKTALSQSEFTEFLAEFWSKLRNQRFDDDFLLDIVNLIRHKFHQSETIYYIYKRDLTENDHLFDFLN